MMDFHEREELRRLIREELERFVPQELERFFPRKRWRYLSNRADVVLDLQVGTLIEFKVTGKEPWWEFILEPSFPQYWNVKKDLDGLVDGVHYFYGGEVQSQNDQPTGKTCPE